MSERKRRAAASTGAQGMFDESAGDESAGSDWDEGAGGAATPAAAAAVGVAASPAKRQRVSTAKAKSAAKAKAAPKSRPTTAATTTGRKRKSAPAAAAVAAPPSASAGAANSSATMAAATAAVAAATAAATAPAMPAPVMAPPLMTPSINELMQQYMRNSAASTASVSAAAAAASAAMGPGAGAGLGVDEQQRQQHAAFLSLPPLPSLPSSTPSIGSTLPPTPSLALRGDSIHALQSPLSSTFLTPAQVKSLLAEADSAKKTAAAAVGGAKAYNRKDKSLGLLCENFLRMYSGGGGAMVSATGVRGGPVAGLGVGAAICLDGAAQQLGVERRRIYDIVNILEAVDIVSRRGKNQYIWHGTARLARALAALEAHVKTNTELGFKQVDLLGLGMPLGTAGAFGSFGTLGAAAPTAAAIVAAGQQITFGDDDAVEEKKPRGKVTSASKKAAAVAAASSGGDPRREQSLGHLSQVFVQMFLGPNDTRIVSLDDAGRWLLGGPVVRPGQTEAQAQATFKSRVRRLYDIANVFTSLELIDKIHLTQTRKPAFIWRGAHVYPLESSVPPEAYTFDLQMRRGPAKLGGPMLGLPGAGGAFDPSNPLFGLGSFGMHGATPGMAALASMGIPGAGGMGAGAGGAGLQGMPPPVPRRATIDTAQLASSKLQQSARAAGTTTPHDLLSNTAVASPETLESLKRSFEQYDAVLSRRTKPEPNDASGTAASAAATGAAGSVKADPVAAIPASPHAKLLSTLQPSLSRGGVDALSERQRQLKREGSNFGTLKMEGSGGGDGGGSVATSAAPSRSSSMFARPLSSMSRSSSLFASGQAAAAAFDPLLSAYARVPSSYPSRVARLPDEPPSATAGAMEPRPLVAWDGTRASAYIPDSRSFLAQYRAVCSVWQRSHRNTFREMEVHQKLAAAAKANAPLHSLAAAASAC